MKSMNDERFFDLAMKRIADQATAEERAELDSALASEPELKAGFDRLRTEARLAKAILPLADAVESRTGELPGYARKRLQTKVRQTLGRPGAMEKKSGWRWWLLLAPATVAVVFLLVPLFTASHEPIVQVAMLDTAGTTRGTANNDIAALQETWKGAPVRRFDRAADLETWEKDWPEEKRPVAKIVYDRAAGEVRVSGRSYGKAFQKALPVEKDLATTLHEANNFITEQTKH